MTGASTRPLPRRAGPDATTAPTSNAKDTSAPSIRLSGPRRRAAGGLEATCRRPPHPLLRRTRVLPRTERARRGGIRKGLRSTPKHFLNFVCKGVTAMISSDPESSELKFETEVVFSRRAGTRSVNRTDPKNRRLPQSQKLLRCFNTLLGSLVKRMERIRGFRLKGLG